MRLSLLLISFGILSAPLFAANPGQEYYEFVLQSRTLSPATAELLRTLDARKIIGSDAQNLPLSNQQLRMLVQLKLEVERGTFSRKFLNDLEIAIDPELADADIQRETSESRLQDFAELLKRFHVYETYNKYGIEYETAIRKERVKRFEENAEISKRLDAQIEKFQTKHFGPEAKARIFYAIKSGRALKAEDLLYLQELAKLLRHTSDDESLINERVSHHLFRSTLSAPPVLDSQNLISTEQQINDGLNLRARSYLNMIMSPRIAVFESTFKKMGRGMREDIVNMRAAIQQSATSGPAHIEESQIRAAIRILEAGIRKFGKDEKVFFDFARWISNSAALDRELARQLKLMQASRNTYGHRISRQINSPLGAPIAMLLSIAIFASVGMEATHQFYDSKIPGWSQQLQFAEKITAPAFDWLTKKCVGQIRRLSGI